MVKSYAQQARDASPNVDLIIILKGGEKINVNFTKTCVPDIMDLVAKNKPDSCLYIIKDGQTGGIVKVAEIAAVLTPA